MDKQAIIKNKIVPHEALTFDDILLLPNYTEVKRSDVDLSVALSPKISLKLPIISAPMDTVTEYEMARSMALNGGLGIIHRNIGISVQAAMTSRVKKEKGIAGKSAVDAAGKLLVGAAVGVGDDLAERVAALVKAKADCLVVDSAHGYSKFVVDAVKFIKSKSPGMTVMAGNVATYDGTRALISAGAEIIRVGMGPGSICTTRIVTGMGVPQISAIAACVRASDGYHATIVADGGIRQIGDIAKALAFGASAVMLGSLLSCFAESPGDTVKIKGKKYKTYRGMGSIAAMKKGGAERYGQQRSTEDKKLIAEGVESLVLFQGKAADYLDQLAGSLRSSFYYLGSKNINEFFEKSRVIKISNSGLAESHPHNVIITNPGGNYKI